MPQYFSEKNTDVTAWRTQPFRYNTGYDILDVGDFDAVQLSANLVAWDPIKQGKAWEVHMPGLWNGGTMTSAGNLVFQGNAAGEFAAYDAGSGTKLWSMNAGLGIVGAPIAYELDGHQYVAVLVGWGGALPGAFGAGVAQLGWQYGNQPRRLLVFALGAHAPLALIPPSAEVQPLDNSDLTVDAAGAAAGNPLFNSTCHICHGFAAVSGGVAPDLRASQLALDPDAFRRVVKGGLLEARGMPRFDDLSDTQVLSLYWYVRQRARADRLQTIKPPG